jgi:hypothetical protein
VNNIDGIIQYKIMPVIGDDSDGACTSISGDK